jgi:hypothetical protein
VAKRKEKEDLVMKCGKEKGKGRLGDEVWQKERKRKTWLPHFITHSSFSFLFATLHHPVFLFLSLCHTSSPSLPFPFSLPHFITQSSVSFSVAKRKEREDWVMKCGKEKGKGRLGDEVWQRERKRTTW